MGDSSIPIRIITFTLVYTDATTIDRFILYNDIAVGDTGWVQHAGDVLTFPTGHGNYETLIISIGNVVADPGDFPTVYIDTIKISNTPPAITSAVAKFYQGLNTPTFKSNLPLAGCNPVAMAILPNGIAVVGSNVAGSQIAAYSPAPYASWTDMTPVMSTGTAVTSIKNI